MFVGPGQSDEFGHSRVEFGVAGSITGESFHAVSIRLFYPGKWGRSSSGRNAALTERR